MDTLGSAQDAVRCALCQAYMASINCENCHLSLCKDCADKHMSEHKDESVNQNRSTLSYPKCQTHVNVLCMLHCGHCGIPVCGQCISSREHQNHDVIGILENFKKGKKRAVQKDLLELEQSLFPIYQDIASNIKVKKADFTRNSQELEAAINKQEDDLHREIDNIIAKLKGKLAEMDSKYQAGLDKQEDEITRTISEITQSIADLKKILDSNDVSLLLEYTSKNAEFRELPPKITVTLPKFTPQEINRERLIEQFGSLSALSFTTVAKKHSYSNLTQEAGSPLLEKIVIDIPHAVTVINTGYENIYSVSCLNDRELWTCGDDKIMKLFNLQGELVKSFQTYSGNKPSDIAVTRSGDLVYTDFRDRTVNIVKNEQIQSVRLRDWRPRGVCSTFSGDLLVITISDDDEQTKVVRYSGSTVLQNIQFDDKGQPLYSSGRYIKYITENRNSDICVADNGVRAVVVVSQAGKFRFAYTGLPSSTKVFYPRCITTDSKSRILTADKHLRIHILDQDGQFLRLIEYCDLHYPRCLCVDTKDNLYVTECRTGGVKIIQNYI